MNRGSKVVAASAVGALSSLDALTVAEQWAYVRAHRDTLKGHLLIGVLTTGVYCLPSCTAREPKVENVRFFRTEEEARMAGLRPCKRCRPDYFYRDYDPDLERLTALVEAMRSDPGAFSGLEAMAARSQIGVTKLHALFRQHYHTTPAAYLSRVRLAAACQMLADPARQVVDVAFAAGYESLSAFHENFRKGAGVSPKDYQTLSKNGTTDRFTITLPEGYLSWVTLKLLGRDTQSLVERVDGRHAIKALQVGENAVLLHMEFDEQQVCCRVESPAPLDPASMQQVHGAVVRMLGLANSPAGFERYVAGEADLARLIERRAGLRIPLSADTFEGVAWSIIGQQVNLPFAYRLRRQLVELCDQPAAAARSELRTHPTAAAVAQLDYEDLTKRQFSRRKAEYLIDTARLIANGDLTLDPLGAATQTEKQLLAVRGLGPWSVNYIMMRSLGFADCVPLGDTGLTSALRRYFALDHRPDSAETAALMARFAPYRSLATYHLWMSLGDAVA